MFSGEITAPCPQCSEINCPSSDSRRSDSTIWVRRLKNRAIIRNSREDWRREDYNYAELEFDRHTPDLRVIFREGSPLGHCRLPFIHRCEMSSPALDSEMSKLLSPAEPRQSHQLLFCPKTKYFRAGDEPSPRQTDGAAAAPSSPQLSTCLGLLEARDPDFLCVWRQHSAVLSREGLGE